MPSERLARFLLTLATVVVVVGTVGVFLFPDQILFLMTVEREVRTAKPGELLAVRAVAALALLGMLTMVAFRKPLGRAVARRWGADTDAFLHDIGSDIRTWMGDPAYRWHRAGLLLLIVWATVLRLIPLGWPIGYDEAISAVWFSSRSWIDVVTDYSFPNNHILYNLITNFLVHAFGVTTLTVRLPAMMAGVLVVPAAYWLGTRLFNARAGLWAAGLTAAAPLVVEYSTQGRGYTLQWLCFLVAFILATYLRQRFSVLGWSLFVIVGALGTLTVPVMAFGLCVIGIWLLLETPRPRKWAMLLHLGVAGASTVLLALMLYLPAIIRTPTSTVNQGAIGQLGRYASILTQWGLGLPPGAFALLAVGLLVALVQHHPDRRKALPLVLAGVLVHTGILALGSYPPVRVLSYLFFVVAAIAGFGLALLVPAREGAEGRFTAFAWTAAVLVLSVWWGIGRALDTRTRVDAAGVTWVAGKAPGADGATCCAEGYFVDAEPIVRDWEPTLREGDALVAGQHTGAVEALRFYLVGAQRSPVLTHPYSVRRGLSQLEPYDRIYLVLVSTGWHSGASAPVGPTPEDVFETLATTAAEYARIFHPPVLAASYRVSQVYRIEWRSPPVRDPLAPRVVPSNMSGYW